MRESPIPRPCLSSRVVHRYTTDMRSESPVRAAYSLDHAELGMIWSGHPRDAAAWSRKQREIVPGAKIP